MSNHGTACTPGQVGEIGGNLVRALPKALEILTRRGIVFPSYTARYSQNGAHLSCAIAFMFKAMYDGHADIAALLLEAEERVDSKLVSGADVWTLRPNPAVTDWAAGARAKCKWQAHGIVMEAHSGHGFCYEVRHDDGTQACYDPSELQVLG